MIKLAVVVLCNGWERAVRVLHEHVAGLPKTVVVIPPGSGIDHDAVAAAYPGATVVEGDAVRALNSAITDADLRQQEWAWLLAGDAIVSGGWRYASQGSPVPGAYHAVGPLTHQRGGAQYVEIPEDVKARGIGEAAMFATQGGMEAQQQGRGFSRADFLCWGAVAISGAGWTRVGAFDEAMPAHGGDLEWPLRDWCARARKFAATIAVHEASYMVRVSRDAEPNPHRCPPGRDVYLAKHRADTVEAEHKLWAAWVVAPQNWHQWTLLRESVQSMVSANVSKAGDFSPVVDGIHILLAASPRGFQRPPGDQIPEGSANIVFPDDDVERVAQALAEGPAPADGPPLLWGAPIIVERVQSTVQNPTSPQMLERHSTERCRALGATWILRMQEIEQLEQVSRAHMQRLMCHPDPLVVAYDVGLLHHWGTTQMVRRDPPFGDGGTYSLDMKAQTRDARLYRSNGPRFPSGGGRVANLRLLNAALLDTRYIRTTAQRDIMQLSAWDNDADTRVITGHVVAHGGDDFDDVLRVLDWMHGLCERIVVVWTDVQPAPLAPLALMTWPADVLELPMGGDALDLSAARNGALNIQEAVPAAEKAWGMFLDPDEWVADPLDLALVRRAVESNDIHAFTVQAANLRPRGAYTVSASVRLWRLREGLRWRGRVHESFGASLTALQDRCGGKALRLLPLALMNRGMPDDATLRSKLDLYERLIRRSLEDDATSVQHLITLSDHYLSRGQVVEARALLDKACEHSKGTEYLGWFKRAVLALQGAKGDLRRAMQHLPAGHHHHDAALRLMRGMGDDVAELPARQDDAPALPEAITDVAADAK